MKQNCCHYFKKIINKLKRLFAKLTISLFLYSRRLCCFCQSLRIVPINVHRIESLGRHIPFNRFKIFIWSGRFDYISKQHKWKDKCNIILYFVVVVNTIALTLFRNFRLFKPTFICLFNTLETKVSNFATLCDVFALPYLCFCKQ